MGQAISPFRVDQYNAPYPPGLPYSANGLPGRAVDGLHRPDLRYPRHSGRVCCERHGEGSGRDDRIGQFLVGNLGGAITVSSPGTQGTVAGGPVDIQIRAVNSTAGQMPAFSATGLPPGVSISASGLITGWPARAGMYLVTVNATDTAGDAGSASFTWTVKPAADSDRRAGPARRGQASASMTPVTALPMAPGSRSGHATGAVPSTGPWSRTSRCGSTASAWTS